MSRRKSTETCEMRLEGSCSELGCFGEAYIERAFLRARKPSSTEVIRPTYDNLLQFAGVCETAGCPNVQKLKRRLTSNRNLFVEKVRDGGVQRRK